MKSLAMFIHSKIFVAVILSVAAVVSVAAAVVLSNKSSTEDLYRIIKVFELTGSATVDRTGVGTMVPYVGMNLENGDVLSTFAQSSMRLSLDNDKFLLMEENTEIELSASGDEQDSMTRIVLKSGAVLNEILKPLTDRSGYEVSTPKATMAVRGTSFRVSVYKDKSGSYITVLDVLHGNVAVSLIDANGQPKGETVMVPEDRRVIIKTDPTSGNDPSVDGNSYFVFADDEDNFTAFEKNVSPLLDIDYESIPYNTLSQIYTTDQTDGIKLYSVVLQEVIDAMNGHKAGTPEKGSEPGETEPPAEEPEDEGDTVKPSAPTGNPGAPSGGIILGNDSAEFGEQAPPPSDDNGGPADTEPPAENNDETPPEDNGDEDETEAPDVIGEDDPGDDGHEGDGDNDGGTPGETEPPEETSAPEEETSAPEEETSAPDEETSDPEETSAPEPEVTTEATTAPPYSPPSGGGENPASKSYLVTFSGASIASQTVDADGRVTMPEDPEQEGYIFIGWEVDGQPYDFDEPVTGDMTITAVWERKTYTVTFDTGDEKTETSVKYEYEVERPESDPVRKGYTFAGWYYNGEIYNFNQPVKSDITITAMWRAAADTPYKVKHYQQNISGDGYDIADTDELTGTTGEKTAAEAKTYTGFTAGTVSQQTIAADGSTEVVILYTRNAFTVTWDTDGGTLSGLPASTTVRYGGKVSDPGEPEKAHCTFGGWTADGEAYDFDTPVTSDLTLTAKWKLIELKVTVDTGIGTPEVITVAYGDKLDPITAPEKEGLEFTGWMKVTSSGVSSFSFDEEITEDITLTPLYSQIELHVLFKDGDTTVYNETVIYNKTVSEPAEPVKTGHTFVCWLLDGEEYDFDTPVKTELTLTAKWQPNKMQIRIDSSPDASIVMMEVDYGEKISEPSEPTRTGYEFVGWEKVKDGEAADYDFDEPVTENFTLRAKWDITKITVTIDAGPYTSKAKAEVDYGSKLEKPSDPVWDTGYKFVEWQKDGTAYDFSEPVTEAFTLTAQWKVQVSLDYGPTSGVAVMMVTRGDTISEPSEPEWEGYEFAGWRKIIGTDITMYDFSEPVTEPFALSALWKVTVTIDKADGSAVTSQKINYADKLEKPDDPEREHYDFIEWRKDGDAYDFDSNVVKSFTLKAAWSPKSYSVVFADGDDIIDEQSVVYGTAATAPDWTGYRAEGEGSDRVKYKSSGWDKDFSNVTGDMEIHPVFGVEAPKYNVRFVTEGGVGSMPVYEGDEATMPKEAEKTIGFYDNKVYTFKGWKDKNGDPVTDFTIWEDTTFTADYDIGNTAAEITLVADGEVIVPEDGFKNGTTVYAEAGTTVTLPEYAAETGYNFGWFKATSGLMTDPDDMNINYDDVYTSFTVSEDSLSNCYQGGSYTTIEFRSYSADETVGGTASASDIRTVLLYNGSYYIGHGGYWFADVEADRGIYIEGGSREDLTMADFTYRLKNGTDITFDQLYSGKRYADVSFAYYQEPKSTVTLVYCSDDGTVQTQQYGAASGSAITHPDPSPYNSSYYVTWYRADPSMADNAEELNLYLDKSYEAMYEINKLVSASTSAVSEDNDENIYVAVNWRSGSVDLKAGSVSIPGYVMYYNGRYYTGYSDGRGSFMYSVMANDATNIVHLTTGEEYTWKYLYENGMLESALDSAEYIE